MSKRVIEKPQVTIWRLFSCWISKATCAQAHIRVRAPTSKCVVLIASQMRLRVTLYVHCLSCLYSDTLRSILNFDAEMKSTLLQPFICLRKLFAQRQSSLPTDSKILIKLSSILQSNMEDYSISCAVTRAISLCLRHNNGRTADIT
jgi:hypothetical protein